MAPLDPTPGPGLPQSYGRANLRPREGGGPANLADILERVLDKGIVIAGDIQINLLDIELLTIKLRLLVASVDRAQEMGINWWQSDPRLSSDAKQLERENQQLQARIARLERLLGPTGSTTPGVEIYEDKPENVPPEDRARLEGYMQGRAESGQGPPARGGQQRSPARRASSSRKKTSDST